jgi:peptide-methionine (S)-S-oxide reductase
VDQVVSGYTGGDAATAHYDMVSTGKTGHVESVKITYNLRVRVVYEWRFFWSNPAF